jgi:2-methylcitrate dehydratase PrpD
LSSSPDLACDIARFAASLSYADLSHDVADAVKVNVLDTLSCALAGSSAQGIAEVADLVHGWGGRPEASVFVLGGKVPAHHAAWLNSGMAHARDYDDTHDAAILHAGVSVVPAAIAAAELRGGVSGPELMSAVAAGLEVMCRLGVAIEVDIVESGFIYSSLLGYFAATVSAGRVLRLDETQMLNALGIVYSSAAGNHQVTRDASLMKRLQPGLAAQAAVVAVQLAQRGVRGAQHVFEGADGLFRVYLRGRASADRFRRGLGESYELLNLSYKPYPCCRDTHSSIDAALAARQQDGRSVTDIESIRVGVTGPGYQMVCVPESVRRAPTTIVEAQFSIPFTVAAALIDGPPAIGHFTDEGVHRADILALAERVHPYVDQEIDRDWSRFVTPARLDIQYRDGKETSVRIDYPKGHPRHRMTPAEFIAKSADCVDFAAAPLAPDTAERLAAATLGLDQAADLDELITAMS